MREKCFIAVIVVLLLSFLTLKAQTLDIEITERERPIEWKSLVQGAQFKDRFLPMPTGMKVDESNWGADAVKNRYVDNGIEDKERSYWGGNVLYAEDGKYHLYVCAWPESSVKGHMEWPRSTVYHTVSNNPHGPFTIVDTIGPGHNPELFIAKDGTHVIYVINGSYHAPSHNGPWTYKKLDFDTRDRKIIEGLSNLTFTKREDGSNLMICRGGGVWFSETGLTPYRQVSAKSIYPPVEGEFEDPVVWKDDVQYHLIVNDWYGRIAFYQRSKDGLNWVTDPGEAYVPGIAKHADGEREDWFKFERIKMLQDEYGRPYQANFAVIDTIKWEDRGSDKYSSKNIAIPLNKGIIMAVMNTSLPKNGADEVKLMIKREKDFDPAQDMDLSSLRFGVSEEVNYGRGSKAVKIEKHADGAIVTFAAYGHKLNMEDFAPKLIGKDKQGELLFGFTRVPWINYETAILSSRKPNLKEVDGQLRAEVRVENFGLMVSKDAKLKIYLAGDQKPIVAQQVISPLKPYETTEVIFTDLPIQTKGKDLRVVIVEADTVHQDIIFPKDVQ